MLAPRINFKDLEKDHHNIIVDMYVFNLESIYKVLTLFI